MPEKGELSDESSKAILASLPFNFQQSMGDMSVEERVEAIKDLSDFLQVKALELSELDVSALKPGDEAFFEEDEKPPLKEDAGDGNQYNDPEGFDKASALKLAAEQQADRIPSVSILYLLLHFVQYSIYYFS
jgi:hypothetical protein